MGTLEQLIDERDIYRLAGLELTPGTETRLLGYLPENPRHAHGKVIYDFEGVFEANVAELRERFAFYYDRFPVRPEEGA